MDIEKIKKELEFIEKTAKDITAMYINYCGEYLPDEDNELLISITKLKKLLEDD
tara:strand:- start:7394 stop:7555 length:162 start_codon:yes stop_codon:yes gene_type:complete